MRSAIALVLLLAACGGNPCKPAFDPPPPKCDSKATLLDLCDAPGSHQDACREAPPGVPGQPTTGILDCATCEVVGSDFVERCTLGGGDTVYCVHDCGGC